MQPRKQSPRRNDQELAGEMPALMKEHVGETSRLETLRTPRRLRRLEKSSPRTVDQLVERRRPAAVKRRNQRKNPRFVRPRGRISIRPNNPSPNLCCPRRQRRPPEKASEWRGVHGPKKKPKIIPGEGWMRNQKSLGSNLNQLLLMERT